VPTDDTTATPTNPVAALRQGKAPAKKATLWENVKSIVGTLAVFLLLRTFLLEAFRIPSGSMIPSLLVGDWLFVNKLVYGPHIPFTNINLPGYADPKRGEVVVFVSPPQVDQPEDPTPTLVKRLIGVPGDTLFMRDGVVHVNGEAKPQGPDYQANARGDGSYVSPLFEWQKQYELRGSRFGDPPPMPTLDNWGPLVLPAERYFMLGDNRYDSKDGRYWGIVPRENFRGRPIFVYYSYNADDSDRPLPFITDIRWGRLGHLIR
jgi:signal peptidase I